MSPLGRKAPTQRIRGWIPEILFLAITSAAGLWAGGRWLNPVGDPGGWWSLLDRLMRGERLYRDVFIQYGPLSPYALSLAAKIAGLSATSFLLMNWIPAIVLGVLLLRAGRPYLSNVERLGVVAILLGLGVFAPGNARLVLPYSPAAVHALLFATAALLLLQRALPRRVDGYLAGALAGLAFCAKQEIGVAALLCLAAPVLARSSRGRGWLLQLLVGFSCLAGLGLLLVLGSAPLESLRLDSHFWPIGEVPAPWTHLSKIAMGLLIRGTAARVAGAALALLFYAAVIALVGLLAGRNVPVRKPLLIVLLVGLLAAGAADGILLGRQADFVCLSMIGALAVALVALLDRQRPGRDFLMAFGLFAGLVAMRAAFACSLGWSSYSGVAGVCTALTWPLLLFTCLPGLLPVGESAARITRRLWAAALLPYAAYQAALGIQSLRETSAIAVETPRGTVWVSPPMAPFFTLLRQNARPGEAALVLPESNAIEALFGLRSVSPFLYHLPGWLDARAEDELLRRFQTRPPELVVVFFRSTWEFGMDSLGRGFGARLAGWITQNYETSASDAAGAVLRRKAVR